MKGSVPLLILSTLSGVIFFLIRKRKNLKASLLSYLNLKAVVTNVRVFVVDDSGFPSLCFSTLSLQSLHGIWMDEKGEKVKEVGTKQNLKPWLQQHQEKAKIGTNAGSSLVSPRE